MKNMLVMGMMMALCVCTGCNKDKVARVHPVPLPPGAGSANTVQRVEQMGTAEPITPVSDSLIPGQTEYVASPNSPYIELPAVSEPGVNERIAQPMNGSAYPEPSEPLTAAPPSSMTFSEQPVVTPMPASIQRTAPEPVAPSGRMHVVSKNETLWRISKKYYGTGKRSADIAAANGITNPNRIYVGMKLIIP